MSDDDSDLSDVDEAQFEDFDPANVAIDERPIAVDEDNVKLLGRHKRKRDGDVDGEGAKKKKKEGKRERKPRKKRDEDDNFSGGEELEGKRTRKKKAFSEGGEKRERTKPRQKTPENEDHLDPEERKHCTIHVMAIARLTYCSGRRRELDRAMDLALKNPNKRRRRVDGIVSSVESLYE
jgi:transcription factor SPN1